MAAAAYGARWLRPFSTSLLLGTGGFLLAVACVEILPEAMEGGHEAAEATALGMLAAVVMFFIGEHLLHMHACEEGSFDHPHHHALHAPVWAGLLLHTVIDGALLAIAASLGGGTGVALASAVVLHRLPDGFFTHLLLQGAHLRPRVRYGLLVLLAASPWLGAGLALAAGPLLVGAQPAVLGFSAGALLYAALADIVPQSHGKARWHYPLVLLAGIGLFFVTHLFHHH